MFTMYNTMQNFAKFLFHGREEIFRLINFMVKLFAKEVALTDFQNPVIQKFREQTNSAGLLLEITGIFSHAFLAKIS